MNNKLPVFFLVTICVSTSAYAETIQFNNGDTLNVELIKQTPTTVTFYHAVIGEATIKKEALSNLSAINLDVVVMLPEGDEGRAAEKVLQANDKVLQVKKELDGALAEVNTAELNAANENSEITQQTLQAAKNTLKSKEVALIAATEAMNKAKTAVTVMNDVKRASEQVSIAQGHVSIAEEKVALAKKSESEVKQAIKAAQQAAELGNIHIAETDVAIAETQTDLAKDKVNMAEEELLAAKDKVKAAKVQLALAKGEKVNDGFLGTGWFKDWNSSIEAGLLGAAGSSVNTTFRTAFNARYEDKEHRWDFKSFYYFSSEDKVTSDNQIYATLVKDWFFSDTKWFAFASTTYDMDSFKDWRHRLQLSVGPGYQFVKTDEWEFSGRMAGTGVFEFDRNVNGVAEANKYGFDAMIGADLIWHITAQQQFSVSNYFYTSLTEAGEFRNLTNLAWTHDIEWFEGLAIKFGIRNEYNTAETVPDEFKYNFSLVWGF